jgi:hypothetical protein
MCRNGGVFPCILIVDYRWIVVDNYATAALTPGKEPPVLVELDAGGFHRQL